MPNINKLRMEWDRNKTYFKAINDRASLPGELGEDF